MTAKFRLYNELLAIANNREWSSENLDWKKYIPICNKLGEEHLQIIYVLIYHHAIISDELKFPDRPPYCGVVMKLNQLYNTRIDTNNIPGSTASNDLESAISGQCITFSAPNLNTTPNLASALSNAQSNEKTDKQVEKVGKGVLYRLDNLPPLLQRIIITYILEICRN